ncbi:MAG: hypothetical protein ACREEN_02960 [Stellaceae bacterium]
MTFEKKNQYDRAEQNYSHAIQLRPGDAEADVDRGIARRHLEKYDLAVKDYTRAIGLKPD